MNCREDKKAKQQKKRRQNKMKKVELDNRNGVNAEELEMMLRMQLEALEADPANARLLPPLMVWGAPGLGKSSILREMAKEKGIGFIDVRLAQREPVDIRGLPVPSGDSVKWLVSSEWPRDPESRGIILFDEITAADRSLQVAAYEFILDRRLGDLYKVPDGWYLCAAGNRTEDRAVSTTMSSALANRFLHVELREDTECWVKWALRKNIHPSVTGFVRYRPEKLFSQKGENLERGWPSPRAWERVSRMVDLCKGKNEKLLRKAVYGLVGNGTGLEFMEFHLMGEEFADVLELMLNPKKEVKIPEKADRRFAMCSAMAYQVWRGRDAEEERRRVDGFLRVATEMPSEFSAMCLVDALGGNGVKSEEECQAALFGSPNYKAWAKKHGNALKRHISKRG